MILLAAVVLFLCAGFDNDPSMIGDFEWLAAGLAAFALHFVFDFALPTVRGSDR